MLKKYKKMIMALVCMIAIMTQVVPAYAAVNNKCEGVCVEETLNETTTYTSKGEMEHIKIWRRETECLICHTKRTEQVETSEGCNWTKYTDLGHQTAQNHRYRITCGKCGSNYEITITTCEAEWTGKHVTPW